MGLVTTKSASCVLLALMIMLCFVHGQEASPATHSEHAKSPAVLQLREYLHHRKMLLDMEVHSHGSAGTVDEGELRTVPAGPDPLHHKGTPDHRKPKCSIP